MKYKKIQIEKFGTPEVMKMIEVDESPQLDPNEVLIKVQATSACFTDTLVRKGKYFDLKEPLPLTPGYDMIGTIEGIGSSVTNFKVGDSVADLTVFGSYSEYIRRSEESLIHVPEGIEPAEGVSLVLSYVTAYQMLHRVAKVKEGDTILIHGAGGAVGTALL